MSKQEYDAGDDLTSALESLRQALVPLLTLRGAVIIVHRIETLLTAVFHHVTSTGWAMLLGPYQKQDERLSALEEWRAKVERTEREQ